MLLQSASVDDLPDIVHALRWSLLWFHFYFIAMDLSSPIRAVSMTLLIYLFEHLLCQHQIDDFCYPGLSIV